MELLTQPGGTVWIVDAPNWAGHSMVSHLTIGIWPQAIEWRGERGLTWILGQMYGVVGPGLISSKHVFRGLRRDMYVRDDKDAARHKLAVTWAAKRDARLIGDKASPKLEFCPPPEKRVFAVYISPNGMLTEFPDIFGWAERWAWLPADPELDGAPIDWQSRYDEKVWSAGANAGAG